LKAKNAFAGPGPAGGAYSAPPPSWIRGWKEVVEGRGKEWECEGVGTT